MSSQNKPGVGKKPQGPEPETVDLTNIEERRSSTRRPTFKAGEIILEDGAAIDCVVRNVSESGCLIKLDNANALPDEISIRIDLDKPARRAEIIWRSTSLAGAMFVREPS